MKKVTEIPPGYYNTVPNYTVERVDEISQSHACTWPSCNPEAEKQEPVAWRVRRAVDGRYMLFVIQETANVEAASQMYREPVEPLFTAPPAQAKEIEGLRAAARQALAVLKGCLEHPDADDAIAALNNAAIAQQTKETE